MRKFVFGLLALCGLFLLTVLGCGKSATTEETPLGRDGQPVQSASEDELKAQAEQVTSALKGGQGKLNTGGQ